MKIAGLPINMEIAVVSRLVCQRVFCVVAPSLLLYYYYIDMPHGKPPKKEGSAKQMD